MAETGEFTWMQKLFTIIVTGYPSDETAEIADWLNTLEADSFAVTDVKIISLGNDNYIVLAKCNGLGE